jgi:hypothetical protein
VLLAPLTLACGGDGGDGGDWTGTITDSASVAIVSNPGSGVWGPEEGWTLEEELRIGAVEGEPDYQFGEVGGIAVDSRGRIYVLDRQAQRIQVYSPQGEYELTIGGPGGGPGELGQMMGGGAGGGGIYVAAGDTLLALDMANQRVNLYGPGGSSLGSFRLSLENGMPVRFDATSSGAIAEQLRPLSLPGREAPANPTDVIVRLGASGEVMDTLLQFPSGETLKFGRGGLPEITFFSAEPMWALTDDLELVFGLNDRYRISVYSSDSELERVITREVERQPVTETDEKALLSWMERTWNRVGVPSQVVAQLRDRVTFKEYFPAFASISMGPAGTIWVRHVLPPSALSAEELETYDPTLDAGARDWDVFDEEGRYLGVVSMPERFAPHLIQGEKLYGVQRDELGVQYAVRLRLLRPGAERSPTD